MGDTRTYWWADEGEWVPAGTVRRAWCWGFLAGSAAWGGLWWVWEVL